MNDQYYVRSYGKPVMMGHNLYFNSTSYYVNTSGAASFSSIAAPTATISNATITGDLVVNGVIHGNEFIKNIVKAVGGQLYVSPTFQATNSTTISCTSADTSYIYLTLQDNGITSSEYAGATWYSESKVMLSGTLTANKTGHTEEIVFSSAPGELTANMNNSQNKLQIKIKYNNASTYFTSGTLTFSDVAVMMYQIKSNGNLYPIGIYIKAYGTDNQKSYIDIFGGSSTSPNARLGLLTGLGSMPSGSTIQGWGIYTDNGFFKGIIEANGGLIGNWTIGTTGMYYNSDAPSSTSITMIPGGTTASSTSIGGSSGSKQWIFTGKNLFGIDTSGKLYASSAEISGKITATSGTIGGCSITDGVLYVTDANISGTISASHINTSSITIAQSQVTNLTTDLGNKASSSDLTTLSNKVTAVYGTSNPSSTNASTQAKVVTCSNFELYSGALITVKFTYANTYASGAVQLNVNSKGAKNIWVANAVTSSSNKLLWGAGAVITFRYDGTQFVVVGEPRTWFGASTTAAATAAKTDTTAVTGCVVCKGTIVSLSMTYENTATEPTLNIAGTGAIALYAGNSTTRPLTSNGLGWTAGSTTSFVFDGSVWRVGDTAGLARAYSAQSTANTANTNATNAAKTATNFITADGTNGIKVHNTSNTTDYVQIISDGTHIYKGGNDVAFFGDTARIGRIANDIVRTQIDSDSFDVIKRVSNTDTVLATFGETATIGNMSARGVLIDANGFKFNNGGEQNFFIGINGRSGDTISSANATVTKSSNQTTIDGIVYYRAAAISSGQTVISVVGHLESAIENGEPIISNAEFENVNSWVVDGGYLWVEDGFSTYSSFEESIIYTYVASNTSNLPYMVLGISAYDNDNIPGIISFVQGYKNKAFGSFSTALGASTVASGKGTFACGSGTVASSDWSFACGSNTIASGSMSFACGSNTIASGSMSFACGINTIASAKASYAEGWCTEASGLYSHAEGYHTLASGSYSHAEGWCTEAGNTSHSEGIYATASGYASHAEGNYTTAGGSYSHAQGHWTVVNNSYNTVIGKYNKATVSGSGTQSNPYVYTNVGDYPFIIGNGTANTTAGRSNAFTVDWSGNVVASGSLAGTGATLTGALSGTSASFSSTISATGATLTGALSGTSASFSSTISSAGATLTGALTGTSATFSGDIIANKFKGTQNVLWSGAWYMGDGQIATLSENVTDQANGIVLVWSYYNPSTNTTGDWGWNFHFIPKKQVSNHSGGGSTFILASSKFEFIATKYLLIYNGQINGYIDNTATGTKNGITYANNRYVLRYVIGV